MPPSAQLPSHTYISERVKAALEMDGAEQERVLASVDAGTRRTLAFDFTHDVTK
jgi:hypothetical protein